MRKILSPSYAHALLYDLMLSRILLDLLVGFLAIVLTNILGSVLGIVRLGNSFRDWIIRKRKK
jgi:ABC-type amino acid transport system permease subunit